MNLKSLIKNLEYIHIEGNKNVEVDFLTIDSRKVQKNSMYLAIKGFNVDGHKFIEDAILKGASLIVHEDDFYTQNKDIATIKVKDARIALADIAKNFYHNISEKLQLIGVTGTNGKTSSTYFMEQILLEFGKAVGVIGTVGIRANSEKVDFDFETSTTPDTIELNQLFCKMVEKKVETVVMEVSSHALQLNKVHGCKFKVSIFTNLTQDHLDLHKNMENYCAAKAKLFKISEMAVINADDEFADKILEGNNIKVLKYSIQNKSDLQAKNIQYMMDKVKFEININGKDEEFVLNIPGKFSVYNALGVIGASIMLNIPIDIIKKGVAKIKGVPGRIQTIPNDKGFNVIVDYAHSPDGLENIIKSVREFTRGRVITIFGCGGDRDKKKRPIMGEISTRLSDYTIITSDNPRSEVPSKIIADIEEGILNKVSYEKVENRRDAIFKGIKMALSGDSVIIAGKGHEDYEIFADKTIYFDDAVVAKEALEDL